MDWQSLLASVLPMLPAQYAGNLVTVGTFLVALCALLARFWPRPADGSRWLKLYELVNSVAQNKGHAANADDAAGKSAGG
ncbi:hypothetical protein NKW54_12425 [Acetobacter cerevisiae]|uniref:Uncharacterized protein n=1 Tax=Acetobacter cerevisiae TaxID=178900 RepID=A0ABT1ETM6_9PROT|nr:hypothetical protein [Acetobacter cerevisiae]MCP1246741.1 hypothetical protein [Acetobacter cerevisiae]MCP1256291.1 hypothetical protein [Acetobacter cerevisiae]